MDARLLVVAIQLVTAAALLGLAFLSWRRRHTRGAEVLTFLCICLAVWATSSALENAQTELEPALFWAKFKYFGILLTPPAWLVFGLRYAGRLQQLTARTAALLSIQPVLALLLIWTTEYHGLYWSSFRIDYDQVPAMFDTTRGSLYWIVAAYSYVLILCGTWIMLRSAWVSRRVYMTQFLLIAAAVFTPLTANVLFLTNSVKIEGFDPTPMSFTLSCTILAFGVLRFHLLDLVPIARGLVIENMHDGVLVLDDKQRIVDFNPAMETILGANAWERIGDTVDELYTAHPSLNVPENGIPFEFGNRYFERQITPILNRQGRQYGQLYVYHDVSRRYQVETELQTRVQQLAVIARVDDVAATRLDVGYVMDIAIDAAMDLSRAEAGTIGVVEDGDIRLVHARGKYAAVLTADHPQRTSGIVGRVVRERQPVLIEDVSKDPDYDPVIAETRSQITIPLVSGETLIGVLNLETSQPGVFTQDVFELLKLITSRIAGALDNARLYQLARSQLTELQTLYDKVRYLELLKTDMIRIAAHDLRNPIHLINTYADLLEGDLQDTLDEQHLQFIASIKRAAANMLRITNSVLSPERIEQSAETMQMLDLTRLVRDTYRAYTDQARHKRLKYEVAVPEEPLCVNGDPVQLEQATANLIVNAIKYTPEGGRVLVSLSKSRSRAQINVEDSGYGIPFDQQEKLFEPFFRAEMAETRSIEGTGLGLHLVKSIVERHFGKTHFQSVEGEGSTFGFDLPIVQSR